MDPIRPIKSVYVGIFTGVKGHLWKNYKSVNILVMFCEKVVKITDKIIKYTFYALFLLVPLILIPWNFELFEYNKMMLVYGLTIIITASWLTKMAFSRKVIFERSPFFIPLVLFLVAQLLSSLFSIDRHTSLLGYYSRFHGGFFSTISYLLLYFALVSNFDKQKVLCALRFALYSATIVAAYGILEHFGIDAKYWVQDVQNRVFSTLGQPNWLAAWLAALLPLSIVGVLNLVAKKKKHLTYYLFPITSSLFLFLALLFTKSRSGILAAIFVLALFVIINLSNLPIWTNLFKKKFLLVTCYLLLATSILAGLTIFWQKKGQDVQYVLGFTNQTEIHPYQPLIGGSESTDIRKIVWRGAVDVGKHYYFFGSGVETFAYSYYQFRPALHNLVSEWDFLYNKAHNEYLNFWATTGAFGLGTYLLLIGWIIWWNIKNLKLKGKFNNQYSLLLISLFSGWLSILITNFFGFSVVPVALLFFLFPAFSVILAKPDETEPTDKKPLNQSHSNIHPFQYISLISILLITSYLLFNLFHFWQADTLFAQASRLNKQGEYVQAFNALQKAIDLNSKEPNYRDEISWSSANLAVLIAEEKSASTSATLTAQQNLLTKLAIDSSDKAVATSPYHLNFWKTRTKVFYKLAQIDSQYLQKTLETLLHAQELAPTDAKVAYNLGLVQQTLGQKGDAVKTLEQTVKIKDNYEEARFALANLYAEKGEKQKAIEQLEYILKNLNPNSPDAQEKLKELK